MKNITVIGDSHAQNLSTGLSEAARLDELELNLNLIVYSGVSAWNFDPTILNKSNIQDSTVILTFGECDIRKYLPRYKNAEEAVHKYVTTTLNFFDGVDIVFQQPVPQSIDELTFEFKKDLAVWQPFENRMYQQNLFYESLKNYNKPVIDIIKAVGTDHLTSEHTDDGCHLKRELSIRLGRYVYNAVD
jgi:hypothetical protein